MSNGPQPEDVASSVRTGEERLRSVLVTYEGAADRRTLYPPTASEAERLTRWLTADDDAYERIDEMR